MIKLETTLQVNKNRWHLPKACEDDIVNATGAKTAPKTTTGVTSKHIAIRKIITQKIVATLRLTLTGLGLFVINGCSDIPQQKIAHGVQGVFDAHIARDGSLALIASIQHGGSLWSLEKAERLYNWNHSEKGFSQLTNVALSPDGLVGLTTKNQAVAFWNSTTGKNFRFWKAPDYITSAAISQKNFLVLLGLANQGALILNIRDQKHTKVLPHPAKVTSVSITNSGKYGITGSSDGYARLWNLQTQEKIHQWKHKYHVNQVAISSKASYAFSAGQHDRFTVWDTRSGEELYSKNNRASSITAVSFTHDESYLVMGNSIREIKLFSTNPIKHLKTWRIPAKRFWRPSSISPLSLTYLPEQGQLILASSDGYTYFYQYP